MTKKDLVYKICNETYHMREIIDSCETNEQIHNANRLACSLVDKWYNLNANFSLSYGADVLSYIASAANDMTKFIEESRKKHYDYITFQKRIKEQKQIYPNTT